jgi:hypothetical protein
MGMRGHLGDTLLSDLCQLVGLISIVFVLAGCSEPQSPAFPEGETNTSVVPAGPESSPLQQFALDNCVLVSSSFPWPGNSGPGTYPQGWMPQIDEGVIGSEDFVELIQCSRVAWGSFERPVTLLVESHSKFRAPESCEGGDTTWMLHKIWTNDVAFSTFLESAFGLPFGIANFAQTYTNSSTTLTLDWSWQPEGATASDLTTYVMFPAPQDPPLKLLRRYLWDSGQGITTFDVDYVAKVPTSIEQNAEGNFHDPMLHASTGVSPFVGTADYWRNASASGFVTEYGDYQCENVLS